MKLYLINHFLLKYCLVTATGLCSSFLFGQNEASKLLEESLQYHDPEGQWTKASVTIDLRETRPGSPDRLTRISMDNGNSSFKMLQNRDGHQLQFIAKGKKTKIRFDGRTPTDTAIIEKYSLNEERVKTIRDYYSYLYGLPMKLRDAGTHISSMLIDTQFNNRPVWGIKVSYPPEIGNDTWYFYFDRDSKQMTGYRFYHDEAANDGEYVTLEGSIKVGLFNLPKIRNWYTNQSGEFLGSDIIIPGK